MPQDIVFILFYFVLFVFQNEEATAMALRKSGGTELRNDCENCYKLLENAKTRMNYTREKKSKYFQKLNENFYKYKHLRKLSHNYSLSKAWGATGMPFNVLYTPNTYQQKILKFVPTKERTRNYSERRNEFEMYNLVLESLKKTLAQRKDWPKKYRSLIPQLFASYGW